MPPGRSGGSTISPIDVHVREQSAARALGGLVRCIREHEHELDGEDEGGENGFGLEFQFGLLSFSNRQTKQLPWLRFKGVGTSSTGPRLSTSRLALSVVRTDLRRLLHRRPRSHGDFGLGR